MKKFGKLYNVVLFEKGKKEPVYNENHALWEPMSDEEMKVHWAGALKAMRPSLEYDRMQCTYLRELFESEY